MWWATRAVIEDLGVELVAMAPFGQVSLRFVGSYCGRCCGGPIASRPLSPSTMLLAGRGFGKTRSGAECIRDQVIHHGRRRIALVAPTAADARDPTP